MHPVNYLFEDIYRNHWGIEPEVRAPKRRANAASWTRQALSRHSRQG